MYTKSHRCPRERRFSSVLSFGCSFSLVEGLRCILPMGSNLTCHPILHVGCHRGCVSLFYVQFWGSDSPECITLIRRGLLYPSSCKTRSEVKRGSRVFGNLNSALQNYRVRVVVSIHRRRVGRSCWVSS